MSRRDAEKVRDDERVYCKRETAENQTPRESESMPVTPLKQRYPLRSSSRPERAESKTARETSTSRRDGRQSDDRTYRKPRAPSLTGPPKLDHKTADVKTTVAGVTNRKPASIPLGKPEVRTTVQPAKDRKSTAPSATVPSLSSIKDRFTEGKPTTGSAKPEQEAKTTVLYPRNHKPLPDVNKPSTTESRRQNSNPEVETTVAKVRNEESTAKPSINNQVALKTTTTVDAIVSEPIEVGFNNF